MTSIVAHEDAKVNFTGELSIVHCGKCGGSYAIAERFRERCREDGTGWHCPYCRTSWGYFGQTLAQKLEKQLAASNARLDQERAESAHQRKLRRSAERSAAIVKGLHRKTKERIKAGVCPCCNRTFQNLARHMAGQHPDYAAE